MLTWYTGDQQVDSGPCKGITSAVMLECKERYGLPCIFSLHKSIPGRDDPRQSMYSPWPPTMAVPTPVSTTLCHTPLVPNSLARPPHTWTKDEVRIWLEWCAGEFSIEPVSQDKFDMNGKALGLLTREDFKERDPSSGDLLFNALQRLMKKHDGISHYPISPPVVTTTGIGSLTHPSTPCPALKSPVHLSDPRQNGIILFTGSPTNNGTQPTTFSNPDKVQTSYVPIRPVPVTSYPSPLPPSQDLSPKIHVPEGMLSPAPTTDTDSGAETEPLPEGDDDMAFCGDVNTNNHRTPDSLLTTRNFVSDLSHIKKGDGDCRLLWEFIHQLLQESQYRDYVCWEKKDELIFRIVNPTGLAELWGYQKNRTNMTYEKLSRALRYYYKMNIIKKVSGKRLTYQFLQHPRNIKKGQRGARPHAARLMKQESNISSPHPIIENNHIEAVTPPIRDTPPEENNQILSQKPLLHHLVDSYDNYDRQPDLQLIGGRLRPTPEDSGTRFDTEEDHTVPYIKPEMPVQEEPEDLSMKPLSRRRSSEVSDYNHVTEDRHSRSPSELNYTHVKEENHEVGINGRIKMECSS